MREQWDSETKARRVDDPSALPVAWRPAAADLVEPWPELARTAGAWPGGPPGDPAAWAAGAGDLAGEDAELGQIFARRIPTRRLVVLGEPGSGKSVLLIRLLRDLIERRTDQDPVPVLFALASWDPARQDLYAWMAGQLRRTYPGLRTAAPESAAGPRDLARLLLDERLVLPFLDGFDELPPALHAPALDAINRALSPGRPLVLASRAAAYRTALTRPGTMVRLNAAAGIHLLPLSPVQAADHLRRDAGGPHSPAASRWDTVARHLGTDTPVGQALSTPLGLFLARTIHNPRPGTTPSAAPHPDDLCDTAAYPDRATLDRHLFNAFIPAAYAPHATNPSPWTPEQARRTFAFLARHLDTDLNGTPDIAWWEIPLARRARVGSSAYGVLFAVAIVLALGASGPLSEKMRLCGTVLLAVGGLLLTLRPPVRDDGAGGPAPGVPGGRQPGRGRRPSIPSARLRWSFGALIAPPGIAFGAGIGTGLVLGYRMIGIVGAAVRLVVGESGPLASVASFLVLLFPLLPIAVVEAARSRSRLRSPHWRRFTTGVVVARLIGWPISELLFSLGWSASELRWTVATVVLGLMAWVMGGVTGETPGPATMVGPRALLAKDRRTFVMVTLTVGLPCGLATGAGVGTLAVYLNEGAALPVRLLLGLAVASTTGLATLFLVARTRTAWGDFTVARICLALRRQVPWKLAAFLRDAHEHRGVLRQVGAVYQFRHVDLQRHLARLP